MSIFNIEEKLLKLRLHKEFLTHCKNQNTVLKGFRLKLNLALCVKNKELQATIQKQLTANSFNIMVKVIKAVNKEIHSLKNKRKPSKALLLKKSTKEFYNKSLATIRNKLETLDRSIRKKQRRKFIRDNSRYENNSDTITKRNRQFSKRKIQQNLTEKRKRYKHNRKQRTIDIKNNLTDENAISSPDYLFKI